MLYTAVVEEGLNFALLSKQIVAFQFKYTRNLPFSLCLIASIEGLEMGKWKV